VPNVASRDPESILTPLPARKPTDIAGLRSVVWRVIMTALPNQPEKWQEELDKNFQTYEDFKKELIVKPKLKAEDEKKQAMQAVVDHPLSTNQNSLWNTFFKDQELWDEIEKDVKRTRREMNFFSKAADESLNTEANRKRLDLQADVKKADLTADDVSKYIETHADVLHRILFIYAKLNPGVEYVQGMNEVLAVIYYCFIEQDARDERIIPMKYTESDAFFAFSNIMIQLRDGFLRELDKESNGIQGRIKQFSEIMKAVEPHAHRTIEGNQVDHQFYSLRWFMLLLCQEFDMSMAIRLWDTLLADPKRFTFTAFTSCALVSYVRDDIIDGDFACCMENLQRAADRVKSIPQLLNKANELCNAYNTYETGVLHEDSTGIYLPLLDEHI
jgi:TBC1 domain family member 13